MFADQVKSGALPPVDKRIPTAALGRQANSPAATVPARQGGQLNMLVASARDTRLMTVYSYTRLIVYDDKFKLHPDILESYEAKDGREFTFKLRAGHKWSDGHPFTTEDFRFFWEDVANNKELSPSGPSGRASGRRPAAQGRDHRRAHHQVQLGQAQSLLHRKPGARRAALPVPAGALPQEVPRQVHRPRGDRQVGQGRPGRQLGADLPPPRRHVRQRQHRPADAQPVGQHHGLAGPALRLRAQSLLSPHRREGTAAALHRPT